MKIYPVVVGALSTNCYLVYNEADHHCIIIDPGAEAKHLIQVLEEEELTPEMILITHGHMDHIGGVHGLWEHYDIPVVIHGQEPDYMRSEIVRRSPYNEKIFTKVLSLCDEKGIFLRDGDTLDAIGLTFRILEVPGHTAHSICFYEPENHVVFVGDTLFAGGVGRTDFYDGPQDDLFRNIREKLLSLPKSTLVLPGHGPYTTIESEIKVNPYL